MLRLSIFFLSVIFICRAAPDLKETARILSEFEEWKSIRSQFLNFSREYPFGWEKFNCYSPKIVDIPKDVNYLSPWNIKVVAALGDSLTAARAASAKDFPGILEDNRGVSFATGLQDNLDKRTTLHHLFKKFNSGLAGRNSLLHGEEDFNIAISGSMSSALPQQAIDLVQRLKASKDIDMKNDWKFVNIFIGSNDLCKICRNETKYGPDSYELNIRESLRHLKENVPRLYVNIMPPFSVDILYGTHEHPFCVSFHKYFCPCLFEMNATALIEAKREFGKRLTEIVNDPEFQTENFTVVFSPVISGIDKLPIIGSLPNLAFLALDCYHFSEMAHDMVAKLVWRSVFEPVEERISLTSFDDFNPKHYECPPQECPFLQTQKNTNSCSIASKVRYPSLSGISVKINNPSLPSMSEMEARAWAEENSYFLIFAIIGTVFLVLAAVFLVLKYRRSRQRSTLREDTPLLLTANLYDDVF